MKRSANAVMDSISSLITKLIHAIIIVMFAALVVSCITQVVTRYVLNNSLPWTEELARYSFMWINIVGAAICVQKKSHARVTALVDIFKPKAQAALEVFSDLVTIFVSYIMIHYGILCTIQVAAQRSPVMRLGMSFVYACVPVAGVCILLEALFSIYRDTKQLLAKGEM